MKTNKSGAEMTQSGLGHLVGTTWARVLLPSGREGQLPGGVAPQLPLAPQRRQEAAVDGKRHLETGW